MDAKQDSRGKFTSAWGFSLGMHLVLMVILWAGYQMLTSQQSHRRVAEKLDARLLKGETNYPEIDFRLEDAPRNLTVPRVEAKVSPPIVPPPMIDFSPAPAAVSNPSTGVKATNSGIGTSGTTTKPNSGKGTPLHPGVNADKSIVYVLDCSSSMGREGKWKEACSTLKASLKQLSPEVKFQIILYHSFASCMVINGQTDLVPATETNLQFVEAELNQIIPEGTSHHLEGLKKALLFKPSALFLLTDADDLNEDQVLTIALLNRKQTVIYPVIFGEKEKLAKKKTFDKLAQTNGGKVIARE